MKDVIPQDAGVGTITAEQLRDAVRDEIEAVAIAHGAAIADLHARIQILHDTFEARVVDAMQEAMKGRRI